MKLNTFFLTFTVLMLWGCAKKSSNSEEGDSGEAASNVVVAGSQPTGETSSGSTIITQVGGGTDGSSGDGSGTTDGSDSADGGGTTGDGSGDGGSGGSVSIFAKIDEALISGAEAAVLAGVTVSLNATATANCAINFRISGGTAAAGSQATCQPGDDYVLGGLVAGTGNMEFLIGDGMFEIPLTICADSIYEGDETIQITFDGATGCQINSSNASSYVYTYTIEDDESQPTVQFNSASGSGAESVNGASVDVVLTHASAQPVTVDYNVSGSASGGAVDHSTIGGTVTFNPGETTKSVSVIEIINDNLYEGNESIILTLVNPINSSIAGNSAYTYTINDDDPQPIVGFAINTSSGGEAIASPSFTLTLSAPSAVDVTVSFRDLVTGDATGAGVDYTFTPGSVTWTSGDVASKVISPIAVEDDTDPEPAETIEFDVFNPTGGAALDTVTPTNVHTYTIPVNDQSLNIGFVAAGSSSAEGTSPGLAVQISGGACSHSGLTVDYDVTEVTANGSDYTLASGTLTWASNDCVSQNITPTIANDDAYENQETFIVTLSNPIGGGLGTNVNHTVTILEDALDLPTIGFASGSSNGEESIASPTISASVSTVNGAPTQRNITVNYAATGGTATGTGTDYTLSSGTLTVPAGSNSADIPVAIVNDSTPDAGETINITLSAASVDLGTTDHIYTINDSEDEAAPNEPAAISVLINSGSEVTLHWTAGVTNNRDFKIAWQAGAVAPADCSSGTVIPASSINESKASHTISGLVASTQYSFRLCAINNSNPPSVSSGLTISATPSSSAYPPSCDATVSASGAMGALQSTMNSTLPGLDGIVTICINDGITITGTTDDRLYIPSSHFFLRATSGRAFINNTQTGGAGAQQHSAIYMTGKTNVSLYGLNVSTAGATGYGIHAEGSSRITTLSNSMIDTLADNAYGLFLDGGSQAWSTANSVITTKGTNSHGIYLKGNETYLGSFEASKIRRNSSSTNNSAVAILFDSVTTPHFDSSVTSSYAGSFVCNIAASTPAWAHYRADGSDPATSGTWTTPGSYNAFNGGNFGAETFPSDAQANFAMGSKCPTSWTTVYTTIVVPGGDKTLCATSGCHGQTQANKWNLDAATAPKNTAFEDGVAKAHFCVDCDPVTKRANCTTSNFLYKVTKSTVASALGWTGCVNSGGMMPKNNTAGQFTQSQVETIVEWMEAGAKND